MAQRKKKPKKGKAFPPDLKREFNRVVSSPVRHGGRPFIIVTTASEKEDGTKILFETDIEISDVIDMLKKGCKDKEIRQKFPELKKSDIDACRAWQVRFEPDTLPEDFNLDEDKKFFLLDENISYLLLYKVARIFGWCSHVSAEGLIGKHNDDEKDIWAHAVNKGYKAVLTKDSDFVGIAQRHRKKIIAQYGSIANGPDNTPVVIHVENGIPPQKLAELLRRYERDIWDFVETNDHRYAELGTKGLVPMFHDSIVKRELSTANDNTPKPKPF